MKAVSNESLVATAKLLIAANTDDEFRIVEEMLYNMINRRKTVEMQENLRRLTA